MVAIVYGIKYGEWQQEGKGQKKAAYGRFFGVYLKLFFSQKRSVFS